MSPAPGETPDLTNSGVRTSIRQLVVDDDPSYPDKKKGTRISERFADLARSVQQQLSEIFRNHHLSPLITSVSAAPYGLSVSADFDQNTRLAVAIKVPRFDSRTLIINLIPASEDLLAKCLGAMAELARQTDCANIMIKAEVLPPSANLTQLGFYQITKLSDNRYVQYWQLPTVLSTNNPKNL